MSDSSAEEELPSEVQAVLASAKTEPVQQQPMTLTPQQSPRVVGIDPVAIAMMVGGGLTAVGPLAYGIIRRLFGSKV